MKLIDYQNGQNYVVKISFDSVIKVCDNLYKQFIAYKKMIETSCLHILAISLIDSGYLFVEKRVITQIENVFLPHFSYLHAFPYVLGTVESLRVSPVQQRLEKYKCLVHVPYVHIHVLICWFLAKSHSLLACKTCTLTHYDDKPQILFSTMIHIKQKPLSVDSINSHWTHLNHT